MINRSRSSKATTAQARLSLVKPRYLPPGTFYKMGLHDVVTILKAIEEQNRDEIFLRAAKSHNASITVDARTVNFVKDFIVKRKMHNHPVGRHIVNARGGPDDDPYKPCSFGRE